MRDAKVERGTCPQAGDILASAPASGTADLWIGGGGMKSCGSLWSFSKLTRCGQVHFYVAIELTVASSRAAGESPRWGHVSSGQTYQGLFPLINSRLD